MLAGTSAISTSTGEQRRRAKSAAPSLNTGEARAVPYHTYSGMVDTVTTCLKDADGSSASSSHQKEEDS